MENKLTIMQTYMSANWHTRLNMFLEYPGFRNNFIRLEMNNSPKLVSSQPSALRNCHPVLKWGSVSIGIFSLILFLIFMIIGPRFSMPLNFSPGVGIGFDIILCMLFFLQHSLMTRPWLKSFMYNLIPKPLYPLLFSFVSGVTLLFVIFFWQGQTLVLFELPGWVKILLGAISVLSAYGMFWGISILREFDPFGLRKKKPKTKNVSFQQKGPYKWVRHPLYLFSIIFIWSSTHFTLDRIVFNVLWSIWIIVGTWLEDRDLFNAYPHEYGIYQTQVPMIIPTRLFHDIMLGKGWAALLK